MPANSQGRVGGTLRCCQHPSDSRHEHRHKSRSTRATPEPLPKSPLRQSKALLPPSAAANDMPGREMAPQSALSVPHQISQTYSMIARRNAGAAATPVAESAKAGQNPHNGTRRSELDRFKGVRAVSATTID